MNSTSMSAASSAFTDSNQTDAQLERRARRVWVSLIVGFLGFQVVVGVVAIVLSTGDPTVAVIPRYHQAALDWDETRRGQELAHRMGWRIDASVEHRDPASGKRVVQVMITQQNGKPADSLKVAAQVYHHARGSEIDRIQLKEVSKGFYAGETAIERPGAWQVNLEIDCDQGRALDAYEIEVR